MARDLLLAHFRWVSGHADVWRVFRDGDALRGVVTALVDPYRDRGITALVGVESRGFLLGGAAGSSWAWGSPPCGRRARSSPAG